MNGLRMSKPFPILVATALSLGACGASPAQPSQPQPPETHGAAPAPPGAPASLSALLDAAEQLFSEAAEFHSQSRMADRDERLAMQRRAEEAVGELARHLRTRGNEGAARRLQAVIVVDPPERALLMGLAAVEHEIEDTGGPDETRDVLCRLRRMQAEAGSLSHLDELSALNEELSTIDWQTVAANVARMPEQAARARELLRSGDADAAQELAITIGEDGEEIARLLELPDDHALVTHADAEQAPRSPRAAVSSAEATLAAMESVRDALDLWREQQERVRIWLARWERVYEDGLGGPSAAIRNARRILENIPDAHGEPPHREAHAALQRVIRDCEGAED